MGMSVINANSVGPDQTPHSAASDLGLYCLPVSHLWDARHKWVNLWPSDNKICRLQIRGQHLLETWQCDHPEIMTVVKHMYWEKQRS